MRLSRTPGWWATRLEFAIAISLAIMAAVVALVVMPEGSMFGRDNPPRQLVWLGQLTVGSAGILIGLAWMVRIYRAPLRMDSKAYWRYHDGA